MKTYLLSIILCLSGISVIAQISNDSLIKEFTKEISFISGIDLDIGMPIKTINRVFKESADLKMLLTPATIENAMTKAKNFNYAFITVNDHTLLKITDYANCKDSGYWQYCMPLGDAYIQKKGKLIKMSDYLNNIIGIGSEKTRTIYFFK